MVGCFQNGRPVAVAIVSPSNVKRVKRTITMHHGDRQYYDGFVALVVYLLVYTTNTVLIILLFDMMYNMYSIYSIVGNSTDYNIFI